MKRLMAMLCVVAMVGCQQAEQVKEGVKEAPADFWTSLHTVAAFLLDLVSGVLLGWAKGLLGL